MARPPKPRRICGVPQTCEFTPCGAQVVECVVLTVDEFETIRLIDDQGLTQEECAEQMNVSRTTVQSIYDSARKKLADVLVRGKALAIRGGSFEVCDDAPNCCRARCRRDSADSLPCAVGDDRTACPHCRKQVASF
jgi:predicted DNA-binding protein (UPF0251 family)